MDKNIFILGAGMTGLAAGLTSGLPIFESTDSPGGICSSYYIRPGKKKRLKQIPLDGEAYRFEIGGGHWIFGADPAILRFIHSRASIKNYIRHSSVYFREKNIFVPYPLQNNLRYLENKIISKALLDMTSHHQSLKVNTMKEWLEKNFGKILCELFFNPFHELYTAGLYETIAPQDAYKSPVDLSLAIQGAFKDARPVGYNTTFVYPASGLNTLAQCMERQCNVQYGKEIVKIDVNKKEVYFADGSNVIFDSLISTLPLNKMLEMSGLRVILEPDPHTSVLVINIGAVKGDCCPDDHWLYNPDAKSCFHRVGFYSNVDNSFLPKSAQEFNNRVSIYVERAYMSNDKPNEAETQQYAKAVVKELQNWGFIGDVEVLDPTWIDIAYTWSLPDSSWIQQALKVLEEHNIYQVGRYGRWMFQGIADSIRDGFFIGASFKEYL